MTTPDPVRLQRAFRQYVDQGLGACAIEASSIGLAEARLDGTLIRTAIFTNFTQDHLDYHGSMADYWLAKRALFDWPGLQAAVINVDDPAGVQLHSELSGRALDLWSISAHGPARLATQDIALGDQGLRFTVVEGAEQRTLQTCVIGHYNVLNLLGVLATLRSQGVPLLDAVRAMRWVASVSVLSYSATDSSMTCAATSRSASARSSMARLDCRCTTNASRASTTATATVTWRESLLPRERRASRVMGQGGG